MALRPKFGFGSARPGASAMRLQSVASLTTAKPALGGGLAEKNSPEPPARTAAPSVHRKDMQTMLNGFTRDATADAELKELLESFGIKVPDNVDNSLGGLAHKRLSERVKAQQTSRAAVSASGKEGFFGTTQQQECPSPINADGSPLKMSANGFQVKALDQLDDMERFTRNVNRILNKLTPEKYESLAPLLIEDKLGLMTNEDYMETAIKLVFDRAIVQPAFVEMYAQLAYYLQNSESEITKAEGGARGSRFRRKLIGVVQTKYEEMSQYNPELHANNAELDAQEKKKKLGNVRFVGELFNKNVINEKIIERLLQKTLYGDNVKDDDWMRMSKDIEFRPRADQIEDLCKLVTTAGKYFERIAQNKTSKDPRALDKVNAYFKHMTFLASWEGYKPRIRIALVNTIDIRRQGYPVKEDQAVKLQELEARNERAAQAKKEGWTHANEVVGELQGMRTKESKSREKKKQKQQAADDSQGWSTAGKAGKAAQATGKRTSAAPAVSAGAYASAFASKDKSKGKDKTKGEDKKKKDKKKKDAKAKKGDGDEEEKKGSRIPPSIKDSVRFMIKGRAEECVTQCAEDEYEKVFAEDFKSIGAEGVEDVPPTVVMEVLRIVGMTNKADVSENMKKYLHILSDNICKKSDMSRGIAWFLTHAAMTQAKEETPLIYKRTVPVIGELLPPATAYGDLSKVFQQTFRALAEWWATMDEDAKLVETVDELHEEVLEKAWQPLNKDLGGEDEAAQSLCLSAVLTLNAKANWPTLPFGGDKMFVAMVGFLVENKVIDQSTLNRWYAKETKKGKDGRKERISVALELLEAKEGMVDAEAEEAVDDEAEEAEEAEEEEEVDIDAA